MKERNLNGSSLSFPQDELITFDEGPHIYTVEGVGEMEPVSHVIGRFFKPFDAEYWSMRKCNGNKAAAAKMREEWDSKGARASQAGTFMHKTIEDYINDGHQTPESLNCQIVYEGQYVKVHEMVNIAREFEYFLHFDRDTQYTPFRTEWCVFDPQMRMAGTIDLLCSCPDGTYEIYDWKRSNKIDPAERNRFSHGINGLEHLSDTSYFHYCLQQNLYRHMLETHYGLSISHMRLVVLHPDKSDYQVVTLPRMDREVKIIYNYLKVNK